MHSALKTFPIGVKHLKICINKSLEDLRAQSWTDRLKYFVTSPALRMCYCFLQTFINLFSIWGKICLMTAGVTALLGNVIFLIFTYPLLEHRLFPWPMVNSAIFKGAVNADTLWQVSLTHEYRLPLRRYSTSDRKELTNERPERELSAFLNVAILTHTVKTSLSVHVCWLSVPCCHLLDIIQTFKYDWSRVLAAVSLCKKKCMCKYSMQHFQQSLCPQFHRVNHLNVD